MTGTVFNIQRYCIHDGPGIRTTVFFKGCSLRCLWCHNPESQHGAPELMLYPDKCIGCGACRRACSRAFTESCTRCGRCASVCPSGARVCCGKVMTADEVWGVLAADRDYYAMSGGGVTLSGGEPLCQPEFALELLRRCRSAGIATAVETAGAVPFDVLNAVRPWVDLFLYDVKCMDDTRHRRLTGVPNGQILANLRRLCALGSDVQIRMPVVPGCNDSEVGAVAAFAAGIGARPPELLAFHSLCRSKYDAVGRAFPCADALVPSAAEMQDLAARYGCRCEC